MRNIQTSVHFMQKNHRTKFEIFFQTGPNRLILFTKSVQNQKTSKFLFFPTTNTTNQQH